MAKLYFGTFVCLGALLLAAGLRADDEAPPAPATDDAQQDGKECELRYKFAPGELGRPQVVHRATVKTTIQGNTQTAETHSTSVKCWKIDDVADDGAITFTHSVESIDMWQQTQGRSETRYNSETDTQVPPGYEAAAESVGIPLTIVTMNDRGKVLERREQRSQPTSLKLIAIRLPDHPVAVGDSWTTPMDIDVVLKNGTTKKIKTREKFTLEKVSNDVATIALDTQILTPIHDPAIEAQLIQRLSNGTVRFDIAAGRVLSQQLDLDRRVLGFSGPSSSMHYLMRFTEKLLDAEPSVAKKESAAPEAAKK